MALLILNFISSVVVTPRRTGGSCMLGVVYVVGHLFLDAPEARITRAWGE
jgi:hypothetical protein